MIGEPGRDIALPSPVELGRTPRLCPNSRPAIIVKTCPRRPTAGVGFLHYGLSRKRRIIVKDPVCGMTVDEGAIRAEGYDGVGFCCEHCKQTFLADPTAFLDKDPERRSD